MARYHVNPTTGNTGPCTAKEGNCPLGSPEENPHFSSVEDARSHAETLMNEKYEWRAVRTVRDQEGKLVVSGGPTGNERTIQEAKTLMEELKKTDSTYPTDGEKSYDLVRRQRHWETVEQETEDPNQLALFSSEATTENSGRKVSETVAWESYNELKKKDSSLARPDVDFGFNWSTNSGEAGSGRVSLSKWHDDPTGTLYVYHGDDRAAVLAHDITEEEVDTAWHELLAEKRAQATSAGVEQPSVDELLTKLRGNNA